MEIIFTNKFKEKVIHAKDGIKFALKGYAFYNDVLPDDIESEEEITINNINFDKLIVNEYKTCTSYRDNLFDLTYIPSLEGKIIDKKEDEVESLVSQYGTYEIVINKGIFKTLPVSFNYIFLIGEELRETPVAVYDLEKSYIAAVIDCKDIITTVNDDVEYIPTKIAIQMGISELENLDQVQNASILIDESFDNFTENEEIKNINLLKLPDTYTLTPNEKNNDYSEEYNYILHEYEEGTVNTKFYPGNITLMDKTEKINNPWNTTPRVYVGLNRPNNLSIPHVQLFHSTGADLHSLSIQYNPDYRFLAINQDEGIDNIQADFFPEDIEEENRHCVPERIKRKNITVNYEDTKLCKSYLRFDANQSHYGEGAYHIFEYNNRGNTAASWRLPVHNHSIIYSDSNYFGGETDNTLLLDSDNNMFQFGLDYLSVINSKNSELSYYGPRAYIDPYYGYYGQTISYNNNNVLIGTNGLLSKPNVSFTANNITFIGNNKNSTFIPLNRDNMFEFDQIKTVKGLFNRHYNTTENDIISDTLEIGLETSSYSAGLYKAGQIFSNQTLIGFEGLTVNKIPNKEVFYENQGKIGYEPEWNQYDYYYYGNMTAQTNRNASIVFGRYNANDNYDAISAAYPLTVKEAFRLKGININVDETFSSFYNKNYTYSTSNSDSVSATVNIQRLFFNHTQDSIFSNDTYSAKWNNLTADEGDFGLDKIVVVGEGSQYTQNNITGHSPAEFASNNTTYSNDTSRKNLFSIEKNSYQLVHNGGYDDIPHYSATNVINIPSMFAVRGSDPIIQQYNYRFIREYENNTEFIKKDMYENINKFNLHHSVYTPTGIFIPLHRSSNDLYKLNFQHIKGLIKDDYIKPNKNVSYEELNAISKFEQTSFVLPTSGLTFRKANGTYVKGKGKGKGKGTGGEYTYETLHDFTMSDLIKWYALNKATYIPVSNTLGTNNTVYTFYIINNNPYKGLNFKGFRMNKQNNSYQTLYKNKYIPKGHCLRVDYMDCGTKGRYGVVNFDYWNSKTNSFYK